MIMPNIDQQRQITIMVSSAVHGIEPLLDQIYATLEGYGYHVLMSHKGTIFANPGCSNFQNCLVAVDDCDVFIGIITGSYGSGRESDGRSITHHEMERAISQDKLRWFLVHHNVDVARQILKQFRFKKNGTSKRLLFKKTAVLEDIQVLEMYEMATRNDVPLSERRGNWVQPYFSPEDALRFIRSQFEQPDRITALLAPFSTTGGIE